MIYFFVSLCRFFRFYSVCNLPRHNSKHKLSLIWTSFLFFSFFVLLGSFVVVGFFLGGRGVFYLNVFYFPNDKKSRMVLKKGVNFPVDSTCVDLLCNYLTYPFFLNVRQTGFLYLLICIYVIFKMLDSLYEKNMKKY